MSSRGPAVMTASALTAKRMAAPPPADGVPRQYSTGPARRVVMMQLIPSPPACFEPDVWREYTLDSAEQVPSGVGPLTFHFGDPVFNLGFAFCRDCTPAHAVQMDREFRCHPNHFRRGAK